MLKKSFGLILILLSHISSADEYHYNNLLIGSKALGLGGAFTGLADDLSAVFYNPAGLTYVVSNNSASISTFSWDRTTWENVFSNGQDLSRSSFSIVPSFLGIGGTTNDFHWGIGFAVSDLSTERNYTETVSITEQGLQRQFSNLDLDNSTMELSFGVGKDIDNKLSIGGSLIFKYSNFETLQGSGGQMTSNLPDVGSVFTGFSANRRWQDESYIATPTLGLMYRTEDVNIGLKLAKDIAISRDYTATHNIFVTSPLQWDTELSLTQASIGTDSSSRKQTYATNVTLGLAKRTGNFEWSFDIDYFSKVNNKSISLNDQHPPITRDFKAVVNYALGVTYYLDDNRYFRYGIFTDNSNDEIDTSQPFQRTEEIDMIGFSVDYTTEYFGFPVSMGSYFKYGSGRVRLGDINLVERAYFGEGVYQQIQADYVEAISENREPEVSPLYQVHPNYNIFSAKRTQVVVFVSVNF